MKRYGQMNKGGRPTKRTEKQTRRDILAHFCAKSTAKACSDILLVSRNAVNTHYREFREAIFNATKKTPRFFGEIEVDEKWFGRRRKPKKKRKAPPGYYLPRIKYGPEQKVLVLAILQRKPKLVYTHIIKDLKRSTLLPIIHMVVEGRSWVYTDGLKSYQTLKKSQYRHKAVNHRKKIFVDGKAHVNNVESFFKVSEGYLRRFQGISRSTFPLHVKEWEFRYNFKDEKGNIFPAMKRLLKIT